LTFCLKSMLLVERASSKHLIQLSLSVVCQFWFHISLISITSYCNAGLQTLVEESKKIKEDTPCEFEFSVSRYVLKLE
jgi:hypothetical protein